MASEYNDFGDVYDKHSYDACLKNIGKADYFVLLIGSRVGGWYDPESKISITQQEYREAYKLHQSGKLKIIAFVRDDVWQAKEERAALSRHLEKLKKDERETETILDYKSKSMNDADFIRSFIAEVGKNAETKAALKSGGPKPTGNWIYTFSTFKEVIEVVGPLTFFGRSSADAAMSKAIQTELLEISKNLIMKSKGELFDTIPAAEKFMLEFPIPADVIASNMLIPEKRWNLFLRVSFNYHLKNVSTVILEQALTSSLFLIYNKKTGTYEQTKAYVALYKLVSEVALLNRMSSSGSFIDLVKISSETVSDGRNRTIPSRKMAGTYSNAKRAINILRLCESLYKHLEGDDFSMPYVYPLTPVVAIEKELEDETVTSEEAAKHFMRS